MRDAAAQLIRATSLPRLGQAMTTPTFGVGTVETLYVRCHDTRFA